jgi:hypothetical protein
MRPTGRTEVSPKRIGCAHPMRRMWKRFSKRSWRNSLPLLNTTHRRSKTTRRMLSLPRAGRPLPIMRIQMNIAGERGSRKVYFLSRSRVGCATANTSARSRNSLVSSVVGSLPILITSVSRKAELYCAGRATNSLSPLCRGHHRELHRWGDEIAWWKRNGIDALGVARALWLESHPLIDGQGVATTATLDTSAVDQQ